MNASWIDLPAPDQTEYSGYLTLPPTGRGPGIVLIQEIWGVNEHIRAMADFYALAGYTVLAPDVFWRLSPRIELAYDDAGNKQAFACLQQLDKERAAADVALAVSALRERAECSGKVATLGYCMGGQMAYRAAPLAQADAAICFYGGGIADHLGLAERVTQPIQFHHAGNDAHITQDKVAAIKQAFAGKANAEFHDYLGAGHGFNCWGRRAVYDQRAAALATGRSLVFLAQHL